VSGDGGFLMNCQELETACRLGLAVVNVIFRDGGYNLIQWKQQTHLGREAGVRFGNPDFVALAAAFGAKGYRVDSARALGPILAEALAQPGPSIVDVPVDYENAKADGGARAAHLSDLSPSRRAPPNGRAADARRGRSDPTTSAVLKDVRLPEDGCLTRATGARGRSPGRRGSWRA